MTTKEDRKPDTKPDGSHDDVNFSAAEEAEFDQLAASAEDPGSFYKESSENDNGKGKSLGSRFSAAATATTPWGRVKAFLSNNKKGVVTGGGILGTIVGISIFILSVIAPTQLVWMGAIFNDFNFGVHDRNVINRGQRIRNMIRNGSFTDSDTPTARQADQVRNDPDRMARADRHSPEVMQRSNQRFKFRANISNKINTARSSDMPRFRWRFFTGNSADSPDFQSGKRRLRGTDDMRRGSRDGGRYQEELDEIRDSDNPDRATKVAARRIVGGSITGAVLAIGCFAVNADEIIPDPKERYEILMSRAADFQTASSQQAAGEEVHGDEVADTLSAFSEREEMPTADEYSEIDFENIDQVENEDSGEEYLDEEELEQVASNDTPDGEERTVARSHSGSAAWKRHTNQELTGNEPDRELKFEAENSLLAQSVLWTGGLLNNPASRSACSFIGNPFVGWTLTAAEGLVSLVTGVGAVIRFGVAETLVFGVGFMLGNIAFDSMVPDGPEELYGQMDMGGNMGNSENSRAQGAPPTDSDNMNELRAQNYSILAEEDRKKGLVWRYLSPDNHRSLLSSVAVGLQPANLQSLAKPLVNIFGTVKSVVSGVFQPARADQHFDNYEIKQFAFSDAVFDRVGDPVRNDQEMEETKGYRCRVVDDGQRLVDNQDNNCDVNRWNDALLMDVIEDDCMDRPYYEHMEEDWKYDYMRMQVSRNEDGSYEVEEVNPPPEIDCSNPETEQRRLWEKIGVWRLDKDMVDNIDCLSHSGPCGSASAQQGGDTPSDLPSGEAENLAQQILDNDNIGLDPNPRSQIQAVADGDSNLIDRRILGVVVALGENNEFTITSVIRSGPCQAGSSRHRCGLAVDFSGTRGINGTRFTYVGHSEDVQNFINDATNIIGEGCEIGVPNQTYVNQTRPRAPQGCNVFVDSGSGAHIHLAVAR